jgi:copper chaperone CopZ
MALETVTLAVGPDAESRTDELTEAVVDVAAPADATVVLLYVFSRAAYEEGVEEAGYDPENPPPAHTLATRLESVDRLSEALDEAGSTTASAARSGR